MPRAAQTDAKVAGVVLAAGASSRMGRNKLLLEVEGSTLIRLAAARAVEAELEPVVVVLGHDAERMQRELDGLPVRVVLSRAYRRGMNASLRAGILALPAEVAAATVILADMPFVSAGMLATLVERYRSGGRPLVVSDYGGVGAPPMLYDRSLFPELLAEAGEGGGREVVRRHRDEATVVAWPLSALHDLDVPEDYVRIRAQLDLP